MIVRAGPTGLTMACELARRGVPFRIIDKAPLRLPISLKAFGIHARTLELFENMGIVDIMLKGGIYVTALTCV
ncbi:MAG: FAD-dependent monooxygenase [Thermodesulfobacteriota bacterium]